MGMLSRAFILAMLFASVALAQQQDQTMMERIMNPNRDKLNPMGEKKFAQKPFEGREFAGVRDFGGVSKAPTKDFATRKFLGIRNPWFGKKEFETDAARGLRKFAFADKEYSSRSIDTREAPDAAKGMVVRPSGMNTTKEFLDRGKSQDAIDAANPAGKPLSIDDVRTLLNRNR